MLIEVVQHVKEAGGDPRSLYGQALRPGEEPDHERHRPHEPAPARRRGLQVVRGDTLREPAFYDGDLLATFDCVIANPPFSLKKWGEDVWASDRFGRNFAGVPPSKSADFAWVQHMITSMARQDRPARRRPPAGRALPRWRRGEDPREDPRARTWSRPSSASRRTSSTAPASPPASSSSATASPTSARARCSSSTPSTLFKRGRNQNTLEPEHAEQILACVPGLRGRPRPRPRRDARRDRGERLQPQHPALRRAARRRRRCRRSRRRSPSSRAPSPRSSRPKTHLRELLRERGLLA